MHQHQERISVDLGVSKCLEYPPLKMVKNVSQKHNFMIQAIVRSVLVCVYVYQIFCQAHLARPSLCM